MTGRDDCVRLIAERLVEIFTAVHDRPPADIDELETFVEMQVRWHERADLTPQIKPHGFGVDRDRTTVARDIGEIAAVQAGSSSGALEPPQMRVH
jgi:hypothetical protein